MEQAEPAAQASVVVDANAQKKVGFDSEDVLRWKRWKPHGEWCLRAQPGVPLVESAKSVYQLG